MSLAEHIRAQASRVDTDPSEPQKEAGNYRKGHVRVHGLPVSIENPRGSFRTGVGGDGKAWKCRLPAHYGYIKRTLGADGDHVDVYLGPHHKSPLVYVIDQMNRHTGKFDEHKCMLGFAHPKQAKSAYLAAFSDGRGKDRLGHISELTVAQFKQWLENGNTRKPLHRAAGGRVGDDTGINVPESRGTLLAQQMQMLTGERAVQMFPNGTRELPMLPGMERVETDRGVFHYDPEQISARQIAAASDEGRENELLGLGDFSKDDVMQGIDAGETPLSVVERDPRGTEVRAAAGTDDTVEDQFEDMDENKGPGHHVGVEDVQDTLMRRRASGGRVAMADGGAPDQADYDPASGIRIRPVMEQPTGEEPEQSGLSRVMSRLTGTQFGEPRAQLWPERMVRSGATIAGDVLTGETPVMQPGLRREDFTDQPKPGGWEVAAQPNDPMMERAQDLAGMAMGSSLGATSGTATLGAGPIRRAAGLPMDEASRMARAAEQGFEGPWYHGSNRTDRLTESGKIDPRRATSGPMPFFTDNPEVATSYSTKKADTSLSRVEMQTPDYFTVSPQELGFAGRRPITVEQSWNYLPPEVKAEIAAKAKRIGYEDPSTSSGPLTLHPEGTEATLSGSQYDNLLRQHRGNSLAALRDLWVDSGALHGEESALSNIYQMAGYPHRISETNAPWTTAEGVMPARLRMNNPLHTENRDLMVNEVLPKLEQMFARDRSRKPGYGVDQWDKNNAYTPKEWIDQAKQDYAKGDNSFVFTAIPDKITEALRGLGYDGLIDTGGKMGGQGHRVAIPFGPEQVRGQFARFDPKNMGKSGILLSDSGAPGAPLAALEHAQPFYSAVERAVEGIAQPKMTGDQWLGTLSNRAGVKPEEMQWTGLGEFLAGKKGQPVTKQEIAQHLAENKVQLQEVTKGDPTPFDQLPPRERDKWAEKFEDFEPGAHTPDRPDWPAVRQYYEDMSTGEGSPGPRYAGYQLPGGENYREVLLTMPDERAKLAVESNAARRAQVDALANYKRIGEEFGPGHPEARAAEQRWKAAMDRTQEIADKIESIPHYRSSHWDEPNVLAHMRMNDRDIGGKRSLHLEEIQSDWHQQGRDKGYRSDTVDQNHAKEFFGIKDEDWANMPPEQRQGYVDEINEGGAHIRAGQREQVPDAPFKKTWHELALKRALREAAEKGYDRLSWTPGEAQAARYDLSKQIDAVRARMTPSGNYAVEYIPKNSQREGNWTSMGAIREEFPADKLPGVVGKDLADKIINDAKDQKFKEYHGVDLKVGGEGMKGFYDQIIPKALEKLGKEHGVKVQRGEINAGGGKPTDYKDFADWDKAKKEGRKDPVWYIDIPQSMKDQAMRKGFSMFNEAGTLGAPAAGADDRRRARGGRLPHMAGGGALMSDADVGLSGKPASGAPLSDADVGLGPVAPDNGALAAAGRGAYQGLTFNFGDELRALGEAGGVKPDEWNNPVAAARGAVRYWGGDKEAERLYEEAAKRERAANEAAAEQHPYAYHGAEAAGSIPAMFALPGGGAAATTAKLGERMVRGGILGAEYGGISGLGRGKGDAIDNAVSTAEGIVGGIIGGAAGPVIGKGVEAAYDKFGRPITGAVRGWANPEAEAARRLYTAIEKDTADIAAGKATGMTPQQWQAAKAAGEPVTLADLGSARTQSLLRSAANTSPEARGILEKALNDRFEQQTERVAGDVRKLVSGGANAGKTADQLVAEYDVARKPAYAAAFNHPKAQGMWDPDLQQMAQAPVVKNAIQMATINAKNEAAKLGLPPPQVPFRFAPDGQVRMVGNMTPNLQFWDVVKKNLDGMGREGQQWSKVLRGHLDQQVPQYAHARGIASVFFGERDALEAGRSLAGKRVDPEVIKQVMRKMNPAERDLFREGYASDWAGRVIKNVADSRDITKAMFNSPNERARAAAVFGPAGMAKIQARMTLETIMDGARKAMGNSTTARQLIEAGLAGGALSGYESGWDPTKIGMGFVGAAGARKMIGAEVAAGASKLIGKVDARTAAHVAELLTSNDPTKLAKGLQMAVGNKKIADGLRRIADRVGSAGSMQGTVPATRLVVPVAQRLTGAMPANADQQQPQP